MSQPFVGEIRMFAATFAPAGWELCQGQILPISEYETLFNLIGTTYGGNGQSTFALPDLRGRVPIHQGGGFVMGETGGAETVTLTVNQIPAHTHALLASTGGVASTDPVGNVLGAGGADIYTPFYTAAIPDPVSSFGGSQPHTNIQPYLALNFIISLFGIYPSQS